MARETSVLNECKCYPRARALRARRTESKTHTLTKTKTKTKKIMGAVVETLDSLGRAGVGLRMGENPAVLMHRRELERRL